MNKKGFTLIELLATIVIIGITITIVAVKIEGNLKKASDLSYSNQLALVEDSAIIYANEYYSELTNFDTLNVVGVNISTLISKGLFKKNEISQLNDSGYVILATINGEVMAINVGDTYPELGGYVAIPETGVVELTSENITSNVNTGVVGKYDVTYSYSGAYNVIRKVSVID